MIPHLMHRKGPERQQGHGRLSAIGAVGALPDLEFFDQTVFLDLGPGAHVAGIYRSALGNQGIVFVCRY